MVDYCDIELEINEWINERVEELLKDSVITKKKAKKIIKKDIQTNFFEDDLKNEKVRVRSDLWDSIFLVVAPDRDVELIEDNISDTWVSIDRLLVLINETYEKECQNCKDVLFSFPNEYIEGGFFVSGEINGDVFEFELCHDCYQELVRWTYL